MMTKETGYIVREALDDWHKRIQLVVINSRLLGEGGHPSCEDINEGILMVDTVEGVLNRLYIDAIIQAPIRGK